MVDLDHLLDQGAGIGPARVLGEQPGGVGQQHQQLGTDQVGDQGGQAVVVAEADLLVGHGVVLVDHRHHAQLQQPGQGLSGMEVLAAVDEVQRGQQHLAGRQSVPIERFAPHLHQPVLPHGGHRLQGGQVGGTGPARGQGAPSRGDGPRRHHHHQAAGPAGVGHLGGQLVDGVRVHPARRGGQRRGADLDHDRPGRRPGRRRPHDHGPIATRLTYDGAGSWALR